MNAALRRILLLCGSLTMSITSQIAEAANLYHAHVLLRSHEAGRTIPSTLQLHDIADNCPNEPSTIFLKNQEGQVVISCSVTSNAGTEMTSAMFEFDPNGNGETATLIRVWTDYDTQNAIQDPDRLADFAINEIAKKYDRERSLFIGQGIDLYLAKIHLSKQDARNFQGTPTTKIFSLETPLTMRDIYDACQYDNDGIPKVNWLPEFGNRLMVACTFRDIRDKEKEYDMHAFFGFNPKEKGQKSYLLSVSIDDAGKEPTNVHTEPEYLRSFMARTAASKLARISAKAPQ